MLITALFIMFLLGGFCFLLAATEIIATAVLKRTRYAELFQEEVEEDWFAQLEQ